MGRIVTGENCYLQTTSIVWIRVVKKNLDETGTMPLFNPLRAKEYIIDIDDAGYISVGAQPGEKIYISLDESNFWWSDEVELIAKPKTFCKSGGDK